MLRRSVLKLFTGLAATQLLPAMARAAVSSAPKRRRIQSMEEHEAFMHRIIFWRSGSAQKDGIVLISDRSEDLIRIVASFPELAAPDALWQKVIQSFDSCRRRGVRGYEAPEAADLHHHLRDAYPDPDSEQHVRIVGASSAGFQYSLGRHRASVAILAPRDRQDFQLLILQDERLVENRFQDGNCPFCPKRFQLGLSVLMSSTVEKLGPATLFTEDNHSGSEEERPFYRADLLLNALSEYDRHPYFLYEPMMT